MTNYYILVQYYGKSMPVAKCNGEISDKSQKYIYLFIVPTIMWHHVKIEADG